MFWIPELAVASWPFEFSMTCEFVANWVIPSLRELTRCIWKSPPVLSRFATIRPEGRYDWIILLGWSYVSGIRFLILFVFLICLLLLSWVVSALLLVIVILPFWAFKEL